MPDSIADIFLTFDDFHVLLLLAVIRVLQGRRDFLLNSFYLLALSLIVNVTLKGIFKVPLPEWLHSHSYAFPSGHMQTAAVFYGWLALSYSRKRLSFVLISPILAGIGFGLIHYGYHGFTEVMAGLTSGMALTFGYAALTATKQQLLPALLVLTSVLCMIINSCNYTLTPIHADIAFYFLTLFIVVREYLLKGFCDAIHKLTCRKPG